MGLHVQNCNVRYVCILALAAGSVAAALAARMPLSERFNKTCVDAAVVAM